MASHRIEQVNALLQRELGRILSEFIEFPKGTLVTITRVVTDNELATAKAYFTAYPAEARDDTRKILDRRGKFIQGELNRSVVFRRVPKISWFFDEAEQEAFRIDQLLDEIAKEQQDSNQEPAHS